MEAGDDGNGAPMMMDGQDGGRRQGAGSNRMQQNQRRLTLEEFLEQYSQRLAQEIEVFRFAIAKLTTLLDKNVHMESFILRAFRDVETSFVTTGEMQQCVLQTIEVPNEQLALLVRLI